MPQAEIARLIETHRDELVNYWVHTVRADQTIQSDADLTEGGLIDHVPVLLDEVCAMLRAGEMPHVANMNEARVHAYTRFRQGYRARDLVREVALLRLMLFEHIQAQLPGARKPITLDDSFVALRTINLYLDEELRYGVAIYTENGGSVATRAPA